ncbi:hypothetical protein, partial [Pseudomonas amygdali]
FGRHTCTSSYMLCPNTKFLTVSAGVVSTWKAATIKTVAQEAKNKSAETILLISRRTYDKVNKSISYALPFACSTFVIPFNFLILPIVKGTHIALSGSRHEHYSSIQKTT